MMYFNKPLKLDKEGTIYFKKIGFNDLKVDFTIKFISDIRKLILNTENGIEEILSEKTITIKKMSIII